MLTIGSFVFAEGASPQPGAIGRFHGRSAENLVQSATANVELRRSSICADSLHTHSAEQIQFSEAVALVGTITGKGYDAFWWRPTESTEALLFEGEFLWGSEASVGCTGEQVSRGISTGRLLTNGLRTSNSYTRRTKRTELST